MKGGFILGQVRHDGLLGRVRPGMTVGEVSDINLASLLVDTNIRGSTIIHHG